MSFTNSKEKTVVKYQKYYWYCFSYIVVFCLAGSVMYAAVVVVWYIDDIFLFTAVIVTVW